MYLIRDYSPRDLTSSIRLLESLQRDSATVQIDVSEFVQEAVDAAPAAVAVAQEEIVALATARVHGSAAWVQTIAIADAWRHRGIGSALLQRLEDRLLHVGVRRVSTLIKPGQVGEEALRNRGFVPTEGFVRYDKVEPLEPQSVAVIDQWGGMMLPEGLWDDAAGMVREKHLIDARIVSPLAAPDLAAQIGLRPPATALLFGPPGTGKTTFAQAIASRLRWPFIELLPSKMSGADGSLASELRRAFIDFASLDHVVIFIDEFDELVPARDARPASAGVVNELLKSIPEFRRQPGRLLICATNFVTAIDPAVLRPGRFDLLIAVGPPDHEAITALWTRVLSTLDVESGVDAASLTYRSTGFTAGDVDLAAQRAAAAAFERSRTGAGSSQVTLTDFEQAIARTRPSIPPAMTAVFADQAADYERV